LKNKLLYSFILSCTAFISVITVSACFCQTGGESEKTTAAVLIVYHGGTPPWHEAPPLDVREVDELTQATPENVNVRIVATGIRNTLTGLGFRVEMKEADAIRGPDDFLEYDGIIIGTPTWFSNVSYPIKRLFDEHLIRIYEHRPGRLNDKVLAGFTTVMDRTSGPLCLRSLYNGLEHLSKRTVGGIVINTGDTKDNINASIRQFCERFSKTMKK